MTAVAHARAQTPCTGLQVAGLWIILSCTTAIGLLLAGVTVLKRKLRQRRQGGAGGDHHGAGGPSRPSSSGAANLKATFWGTTLSSANGFAESGPPSPQSHANHRVGLVSRFAGGGSARPSGTGVGDPSSARSSWVGFADDHHDGAHLPGGFGSAEHQAAAVGKEGQRSLLAVHAEAGEGR